MARRMPVGVRAEKRGKVVTYQARWVDERGARHSATFDTVSDAAAHRAQMDRNVRRGASADPTPGKTLFSDWAETWWATRDVRASTKASQHTMMNRHIVPHWGQWRLIDIKADHIRQWMVELARGGDCPRGPDMSPLQPSTVNKVLTMMKLCMAGAVDADLIETNPATRVKQMTSRPDERRFLEPWELEELEAGMLEWWRPMLALAIDSALRLGELGALQVKDLDLLKHSVRVRGTAVEVSKRFTNAATMRQVTETKTARGRRVVPTLTPSTVDKLAAMIAERGLGPEDTPFTGRQGAPLRGSNFRPNIWKPAVTRAGLAAPLPTPHSLRHTAISLWIAAGTVNPMEIAMWAGHSSINTTYSVYGHLIQKDASATITQLTRIHAESSVTRRNQVVQLRSVPAAKNGPGRTDTGT